MTPDELNKRLEALNHQIAKLLLLARMKILLAQAIIEYHRDGEIR
jgi:hypothetical protein